MHHFVAARTWGKSWIALLLVLVIPHQGFAQNPDPSPSPTLPAESGDVEGQKNSLREAKRAAARGEDSAKTSQTIYAAVTAVCTAACYWNWTGAAEAACIGAAGAAIVADVALIASNSKRFRNSWKEIVGGAGAAAVWGATYALATGAISSSTTFVYSHSCAAAVTTAALVVAKEFPIRSMRKAKNEAASELARLEGGGDTTRFSDGTLPSFGQGVRSAAVADPGRGGVPGAAPPGPGGGGGGGGGGGAAATAGCSSFALSRDVAGTANCLRQQGEQIPKNITSPEFADAFRKASGAELGQFLKAGTGEGNTAEGLLKKATANIEGINGSKFAAFADVVRSELSMYRGGGGGGGAPARRVAQDDDNATVARADGDGVVKFADPTPADTSLFGRATAQYKRLMKSKLFEMP